MLCSSYALAADVAVFPVEATNVSPNDAAAIGEVFAQSYALVSSQVVLAPSTTAKALTADGATTDGATAPDLIAAARSLGVREYIRLSAVGLASKTVLEGQRFSADGTLIHRERVMLDALENTPVISDQLSKALFTKQSERAPSPAPAARPPAQRSKPKTYEQVLGFKTGLHFPIAPHKQVIPSLSAQFDMRLETDRYFIEFGAGLLLPTDTGEDFEADNKLRVSGLVAEFGADYLLTSGDVAPYVGGGLRPGLTFNEGSLASLAPFAQLGLAVARRSATQFYAQARVAQNVLPIKAGWEDDLDEEAVDRKSYYPTEIIVEMGLGW